MPEQTLKPRKWTVNYWAWSGSQKCQKSFYVRASDVYEALDTATRRMQIEMITPSAAPLDSYEIVFIGTA